MKKTLSILLIFIFFLTLVSCAPEEKVDIPDEKDPIKDTDIKLVNNGSTDYKILYPANADEIVSNSAVEELKYFFKEATGITLEAISDSQIDLNDENQKYLSIGNTSLLRKEDIKISLDKLGESGLEIKLVNENVFMFGASRYSDLYSVYSFLEHQFKYEVYAPDEFHIERNVINLNLLDFDLVDIPSFEYRLGNHGELWFGTQFTRRMRMHKTNDIWISLGGLTYHNFYATVSPEKYQQAHPEWFNNGQLALMTDPEGISEVVINEMKKYISENPNANLISFTQEDYNKWSESDKSKELRNKYGTDAAEMVQFINIVAKAIEEWLFIEEPGRKVTLIMFAYHKTELAPAKLNETTKEYEPIDDSVKLRSNVAVIYAPIFANHYYDYYHPENIEVAETMKKWKAVSDQLFVWSYSTYFPYYFVPYDSFNSMQGKYQFALENNTKYMFDQAQFNQAKGTDWYRLKQYLSAKLQWDAYQDMDTLVNNFMENYFKEAKDPMMNYYNSYRTWYAHLADNFKVNGYVSGTSMLNVNYWPRGVLQEWMGYINQALDAIKPLEESDPALYKTLKDRITLESISIRFLLIEFHSLFYTEQDLNEMKESLKYDATVLGISQYNEMTTIEQYFKNK